MAIAPVQQAAPTAVSSSHRRTALAVLALCFAAGVAGRGLLETFLVFLLPLTRSFGWERAEVISIYSLAMLTSGLTAPVVGRLFDRSGPRTVYASGLVLLGAGLSLAPFADALWQLQICLGLAAGFAGACLGNVPNSALVSRWFTGRLGVATSIVYSGAGIGILLLVPLAQLLIERLGWRDAYHWLGGGTLLAAIPVLFLPWRRWRAGRAEALRPPTEAGSGAELDAWTLVRAVRHPAFWGLSAVFFFTSIGMYSIVAQVVAYLVEIGFSPMVAATAWGVSGVLLPAGMLVTGWLDGVIGRRRSILLSYGITMTGMACLYLLGRFPNIVLLAAFVVCFGGTLGSRGPLISMIAMRLFHGGAVATIFGTIAVGAGLGAAIGSALGGLIHDLTGRYDLVIALAFCSILCGMLPFLTVRALR
jgi:MFS family permease